MNSIFNLKKKQNSKDYIVQIFFTNRNFFLVLKVKKYPFLNCLISKTLPEIHKLIINMILNLNFNSFN